MTEAARQGDPIAHTHALNGLLAGLAIGATVALIGVAVVGTGGLAAVAAVGVYALMGAVIGEVIGSLSVFTKNTGHIITVYINGRPAARASLSAVLCAKCGPCLMLKAAAASISTARQPLASATTRPNRPICLSAVIPSRLRK